MFLGVGFTFTNITMKNLESLRHNMIVGPYFGFYESRSKITSSTFDLFLIWTKIHLYKPPVQNLQKALFSEWWCQSNYQNPLETVDLDNLTSNPLNNAEKHAQSNNCQVTLHSECEVTEYDTLGSSNTGINIGQHASTCGREQSCH